METLYFMNHTSFVLGHFDRPLQDLLGMINFDFDMHIVICLNFISLLVLK